MTPEQADQRALEFLVSLGRVAPPSAAALAAARESVWPLIAVELFRTDRTGESTRPRPDEASRPAARRRPGQAPEQRRHRRAAD
jgi:hypothetical protein